MIKKFFEVLLKNRLDYKRLMGKMIYYKKKLNFFPFFYLFIYFI